VDLALLGALRLLASGPLLVAVDDVQWLDAPSAAALAFAVRRLREEPVALLLTRRLEEAEEARCRSSCAVGRA
jgi:predicted ATPase